MSARMMDAQGGTRLEQLRALLFKLAAEIDICDFAAAVAPLARQYRETLKEIEELEGAQSHGDEISELLAQRKADGKPGAVRKNRAGV